MFEKYNFDMGFLNEVYYVILVDKIHRYHEIIKIVYQK